jgi:hypothetical protein
MRQTAVTDNMLVIRKQGAYRKAYPRLSSNYFYTNLNKRLIINTLPPISLSVRSKQLIQFSEILVTPQR